MIKGATKKNLTKAFIGTGFVILFMASVPKMFLSLNLSWSAPYWAFAMVPSIFYPGPINKGDWVRFQPRVKTPYKYIKKVTGIAGDEIIVGADRSVYVAGRYVGTAKTHSINGRRVEAIKSGKIPEGYLFITAPHIDSHDSRYAEIGLICVDDIEAIAWPMPDFWLVNSEDWINWIKKAAAS